MTETRWEYPGHGLTDEEFLEIYRVLYRGDGFFIFGRAETNDWDYEYVSDDGSHINPGWSFRGRIGGGVHKWLPLRDERIINLLRMIVFPEVLE